MAYLSLYRKYRPQTFSDILGQDHVSTTLTNAIEEDRVAHAYLFTGPRGTGKTSTARILAKALNCVEGPTASPCGKCESCVSITEGSSLDVIEMDAASHSKVEETRDILSGVPLATAGSRLKVYVIDEVHMLTTQSFNALLKTLEEPPEHVLFVLATTEAHKVLPTIVSRTQRFDFRRVAADVIEAHLAEVAKLENIDIEPDALAAIARHAEGSMRDALSALDQLSSVVGRVSVEDAEGLLGQRREAAMVQLFEAIAAEDVGGVFHVIQQQIAEGADPRQLALGALGHARSLLLLRTSPDAGALLDVPEEDRATVSVQAGSFSPGQLLRTLDLTAKAITDMRNAPNHRLLLEVALVRAAAPETDPSAGGLLGRIERLERRLNIEPAVGEVASEVRVPETSAGSGSASRKVAAPTAPRPKPRQAPRPASPKVEQRAEEPPASAPAAAGDPGAVGLGQVRDAWSATVKEVNDRSRRVGAFINPSQPLRIEGDSVVIEVQSKFHRDAMTEDRNRRILAESLHAALGVHFSPIFVERGSDPGAPLDADQAAEGSGKNQLPDAVEAAELTDSTTEQPDEVHDPVELVKRGFSAEVVEDIEGP